MQGMCHVDRVAEHHDQLCVRVEVEDVPDGGFREEVHDRGITVDGLDR